MRQGVGIDFGTTNSVVALYDSNLRRTEPLTNTRNLPHPSVVWYKADGSVKVGIEAKENLMGYSNVEGNSFVYSVKRKLGKEKTFHIFGHKLRSYEVAAEIFRYLREEAENRKSGYDINEAIVTIPVYFNGFARMELREAAERAGIFIRNFVHEPFAAIVGYCLQQGTGLHTDLMENQLILVYDWGGGTLDITLVQILDGGAVELATAGLEDKAGDYFDDKLARFSRSVLVEQLKIEPNKLNILPSDLDRLRSECERAKIGLSTKTTEAIRVASIWRRDGKLLDMDFHISRTDFNKLIESDVEESLSEVKKALETANVNAKEVDQVLLIGGTSRIPLVRDRLRDLFGHRIVEVQNANTIIAEGAAVVDAMGLQPSLARSINVELSDGTLYEIFKEGLVADTNVCRKKINFFCTDNRDGEAKLVIKDLAGRVSATKPLLKTVLSVPVSSTLPIPYQHERVTVEFALDDDMVLNVSGKGATQKEGVGSHIYDLCFGLKLQGGKNVDEH